MDGEFSLKKMVHVSMDGPNVNLAMHRLVEEYMEERYDHGLLNVGTCCLHQLHNAFRDATHSNEWGIGKFLSALYYLFNKVPARREEYETLTSSSEMPKKFCAHRWAENLDPAKRAIVMLPHLRTCIKGTVCLGFYGL